ncbi:MAG: cytochrome C [Bacteroidetes bacterium B1(2017)]|nr:MAG: cytochrome C [Bacteroidetes bacterium B1(2017)]
MNSSLFKKIALVLVAVLVVLQFVQPSKNEGSASGVNDITQAITVPASVQQTLEKSCYDCHSNHTTYPWYTKIQPIGLWMQYHVNEGKEELNFSEFKTYKLKRQAHKLEEIAEQVEEGEMPLSSFTLIHKDAILSDAQKGELISWAKENHLALKQKLEEENGSAPPPVEEGHEHHE